MKTNHAHELPRHIADETNGLSYTLHGDYYIPDIEYGSNDEQIGRWGQQRMAYIKKQHPCWFSSMVLNGTLNAYLHEIDQQAQKRYDTLMKEFIKHWKISEKLKECDQMKWVELMGLAKAETEENIYKEIIIE